MIRGEATLGFGNLWRASWRSPQTYARIGLMFAAIVGIVAAIETAKGRSVALVPMAAALTAAVLAVVALHAVRLWLVLRRGSAAQRHLSFEIDEEAVVLRTDGKEHRLPWHAILEARETGSAFLLYSSPRKIARVILKLALADNDVAAMRALLVAKLGPKAAVRA
ncbi:MAG TPA: YcxB family protein [Rhizomicrobium sp.]